MTCREDLPEGYRVREYEISRWYDEEYVYAYALEVWETRDVGHLWWKHQERGWWTVDKSIDPEELVQTAWLHKG